MTDQPEKTPRKRLSRAERAESQAKDEPKSWGGKHNPDAETPEPENIASEPKVDPAEFERGFAAGRNVGRLDAERDMRNRPTYGNSALLSLNQEEVVTIALQRWQFDFILYGLGTRLRDHQQSMATMHPGIQGAGERAVKCLTATIADITTQIGDVEIDHLTPVDRLTTKPQLP